MREGAINEDVQDMLLGNVRVPQQVLGDLNAQVTANQVCGRRLNEFLDDAQMTDLTGLSAALLERAVQTAGALSQRLVLLNGRLVPELGTAGTLPWLGRKPITLLNAAGLRNEPIMSLPSAVGSMWVAMPEAEPPLDPPAVSDGS